MPFLINKGYKPYAVINVNKLLINGFIGKRSVALFKMGSDAVIHWRFLPGELRVKKTVKCVAEGR